MELKVGDKVNLYRIRYGQDFGVWEHDFEGKEFTVKDVSNGKVCLTAYGYGELNPGLVHDGKAYGNGAIYVSLTEFSRPEMTISRIKKEIGYGRTDSNQK